MAGEQITIGVRGIPETKAKFDELSQQTGLNQREFLEMLINNYESNKARESMGQVKEIENLRHHLARIEETYISLVKAGQDRNEACAIKITGLEQEALQAKAAVMEAKGQADRDVQLARDQAEAARAEAALVRENAAREVQDIKEALAQAREAQEQSARLANLAEEASAAAKAKVAELEEKASLADQYKKELEGIKQINAGLVQQLEKTEEEMERQLERAKSDNEKALLVLRSELTEKLRAEYEERTRQAVFAVEAKAEERLLKVEQEADQAREKASIEIAKIREALDKERDARVQAEKFADKANEKAVKANASAEALQEKANLADRYLQERNDLEARLQQAVVDADKSLLAKEREYMKEISKLREDLAQAREEKAAVEVLLAQADNKQTDSKKTVKK